MRTRAALPFVLLAATSMMASALFGANAAGARTLEYASDAHDHPTNTTSPVPLSPGARMVAIKDATLTASDGIGFALHPSGDPIAFHSTSPGLELCPADAQPALLAIVHPSQPAQPYTCVPFDENGDATAVSPSGGAGHVGFVVRTTANTPRARIDALTLQYTAIDQFFTIFPPKTDETRLTITLTPERATIIAAQSFLYPDTSSLGTPKIVVKHGRTRLRQTTPVVALDATCYGPAALHKPVVVRMTQQPKADQTVGIVLQWA